MIAILGVQKAMLKLSVCRVFLILGIEDTRMQISLVNDFLFALVVLIERNAKHYIALL